ncbi:Calcium/calmodulin-dependent protein kinase type 1 [Paramyrothecium foliicola]|nr:Calcium/calmodulin-dependent protein kinase type 1 [Paramyrothecium foliicola]
MPGSAAISSDLVRDSQLQPSVSPGLTHHTYYVSSVESGHRRTRHEETWARRRELGNGTFGRVWLEECEAGPKQGQLRAVKQIAINRDSSVSIDYGRELEAMAKFSNEKYVHYFVRSFGWYRSRVAVYISMEFLEYGDLQKYLVTAFSEAETQQIIAQVAEGLGYMHGNGFAHRDLKPANLLVMRPRPDWWVKIGDFGISKRADDNSGLRTFAGTHGYLAPELNGLFPFSEHSHDAEQRDRFCYTTAVDIWAMGEIAVRLLAQRSIFSDARELYNYVVREQPFLSKVLAHHNVSDDCLDFIKKAMAASSVHRLKADEPSKSAGLDLPSGCPKRSTTRIPSKLVTTRALDKLRIPFKRERKTVKIPFALSQDTLDELLELSERTRKRMAYYSLMLMATAPYLAYRKLLLTPFQWCTYSDAYGLGLPTTSWFCSIRDGIEPIAESLRGVLAVRTGPAKPCAEIVTGAVQIVSSRVGDYPFINSNGPAASPVRGH